MYQRRPPQNGSPVEKLILKPEQMLKPEELLLPAIHSGPAMPTRILPKPKKLKFPSLMSAEKYYQGLSGYALSSAVQSYGATGVAKNGLKGLVTACVNDERPRNKTPKYFDTLLDHIFNPECAETKECLEILLSVKSPKKLAIKTALDPRLSDHEGALKMLENNLRLRMISKEVIDALAKNPAIDTNIKLIDALLDVDPTTLKTMTARMSCGQHRFHPTTAAQLQSFSLQVDPEPS